MVRTGSGMFMLARGSCRGIARLDCTRVRDEARIDFWSGPD